MDLSREIQKTKPGSLVGDTRLLSQAQKDLPKPVEVQQARLQAFTKLMRIEVSVARNLDSIPLGMSSGEARIKYIFNPTSQVDSFVFGPG